MENKPEFEPLPIHADYFGKEAIDMCYRYIEQYNLSTEKLIDGVETLISGLDLEWLMGSQERADSIRDSLAARKLSSSYIDVAEKCAKVSPAFNSVSYKLASDLSAAMFLYTRMARNISDYVASGHVTREVRAQPGSYEADLELARDINLLSLKLEEREVTAAFHDPQEALGDISLRMFDPGAALKYYMDSLLSATGGITTRLAFNAMVDVSLEDELEEGSPLHGIFSLCKVGNPVRSGLEKLAPKIRAISSSWPEISEKVEEHLKSYEKLADSIDTADQVDFSDDIRSLFEGSAGETEPVSGE